MVSENDSTTDLDQLEFAAAVDRRIRNVLCELGINTVAELETRQLEVRRHANIGPTSRVAIALALGRLRAAGRDADAVSAAPDQRPAPFDRPCLIELLGHNRIVGRVRESDQPWLGDIRVDTLGESPSTHYVNKAAVSVVHPIAEDVAMELGGYEPVKDYEVSRLPAADGPPVLLAEIVTADGKKIRPAGNVWTLTMPGKSEPVTRQDGATMWYDTWQEAAADDDIPF